MSRWDAVVFRSINSGWSCRVLDHVMVAATMLGEGVVLAGLSLFFVTIGLLADRLNWRQAGYAGLIAYAFSGAAVLIAKSLWDRPRPLLVLYDIRIVDAPLFGHSVSRVYIGVHFPLDVV